MITTNPPSSPHFSIVQENVQETTLRRRLRIELIEIQTQINQSGLHDEMTEHIRLWQDNFFTSIHLRDSEEVKNEFITLLQELLRDPISYAPLDEESLLGSDGRTYGHRSLALYLQSVPEEYRHRSPLDPQNDSPFTTIPHPIVRHMVRWLQSHNAFIRSEEVEGSYQRLVEQGNVPLIPTSQTEKIRRIRERQTQRNQERRGYLEQFEQELIQEFRERREEIRQTFSSLDRTIQEVGQRNLERVQTQQLIDQERLGQVQQRVTELTTEVEELNRHNEQLEERIHRVGVRISETERIDAQLQIVINQTRIAIKKRQKNELGALLGMVAMIGACTFTTWALQSFFFNSGIQVTLISSSFETQLPALTLSFPI